MAEADEIALTSEPKKGLSLKDLSSDQWKVYSDVLQWHKGKEWNYRAAEQVFTVGGLAGAGKTTVTALLLEELCNRQGKSVAVVTPTGKASCVLRQKLGALADRTAFLGTIHSFMYIPVLDEHEQLKGWSRRYFEKDGDTYRAKAGNIPKLDLLVVDESSMLNEAIEEDLMAFGLPILAVGDHGQLPPVVGKNTWMLAPRARLEQIHRQAADNPILALATYVREMGELPKHREVLRDIGIGYFKSLDEASDPLLEAYKQQSLHEVAVLTYTNALRCRLNAQIHTHLQGSEKPATGSQIICLRNDNSAGLVNGMRGFVDSDVQEHGPFYASRVFFPDENFRYSGRYPQCQFGRPDTLPDVQVASKALGVPIEKMKDLGALFDYGYALTCHKSQGSQFTDVFVMLQTGIRSSDYGRWLYTAVTRASERLSFVETRG